MERNVITWHARETLSRGANPLVFHELFSDPRRIEIKRKEEKEKVEFIIDRNMSVDGARRRIAEEGITLDQHHDIHPFGK